MSGFDLGGQLHDREVGVVFDGALNGFVQRERYGLRKQRRRRQGDHDRRHPDCSGHDASASSETRAIRSVSRTAALCVRATST